MLSGLFFFFSCNGMFCKVANELENKSLKVDCHITSCSGENCLCVYQLFALSRSEKMCSTDNGEM